MDGVLLALIIVCTFSRHCDTCSSLSSCAQLNSGCVCACNCVGMCIVGVYDIKLESGAMMVKVLRQYFQLSNCEVSAVQ